MKRREFAEKSGLRWNTIRRVWVAVTEIAELNLFEDSVVIEFQHPNSHTSDEISMQLKGIRVYNDGAKLAIHNNDDSVGVLLEV